MPTPTRTTRHTTVTLDAVATVEEDCENFATVKIPPMKILSGFAADTSASMDGAKWFAMKEALLKQLEMEATEARRDSTTTSDYVGGTFATLPNLHPHVMNNAEAMQYMQRIPYANGSTCLYQTVKNIIDLVESVLDANSNYDPNLAIIRVATDGDNTVGEDWKEEAAAAVKRFEARGGVFMFMQAGHSTKAKMDLDLKETATIQWADNAQSLSNVLSHAHDASTEYRSARLSGRRDSQFSFTPHQRRHSMMTPPISP